MSDFDSFSEEEIDLKQIQYKPKKKEPKQVKKPVKKDVEKVDKVKDKVMDKVLEKQLDKRCKKPMPTEEELIEKRRMILLIQFYLIEFPVKLKTFKKINLEKKSYDELVDIKKELDFTVGQGSNVAAGVQMLSGSIQALEIILVNFTPINATNLSRICDDQETIDTMKHIILKHSTLINSEPEMRLLYKIVMTTLMLHNMNGSISTSQEQLKSNESIIIINKDYVDI